jgi:flagellar motor protein MotB
MAKTEPQEQSTTAQDVDTATTTTSKDMLDLVMAQTLGLAMQNAVTAQQNAQILNSAIVAATCTRILSARNTTDENAADDIVAKTTKAVNKIADKK